MTVSTPPVERTEAQFRGLRMTADEFFQIPDDGYNYELIDGVVITSPSPNPLHQAICMEIAVQLGMFLRDHPVGRAFPELDAHIGQGPTGGDLIYRPEVIFIRAERLPEMRDRIVGPPDLAVEIISPESVVRDYEDKRRRYEAAGVREYWIIDADEKRATFLVLKGDRFEEAVAVDHIFRSSVLAGLELDVRWLWQRPLPATLTIVQEMLARLDRSSSDS